ncbi:hypothetical protein FCV25MIE_16669 [Fagus crenata]
MGNTNAALPTNTNANNVELTAMEVHGLKQMEMTPNISEFAPSLISHCTLHIQSRTTPIFDLAQNPPSPLSSPTRPSRRLTNFSAQPASLPHAASPFVLPSQPASLTQPLRPPQLLTHAAALHSGTVVNFTQVNITVVKLEQWDLKISC